ncbi:MAG: exopolysaccharide biosynthesis protein [Rhodoferax sp.]|nr:exopolysaccharide biosynthesis protein [Rhodoferax sp.]
MSPQQFLLILRARYKAALLTLIVTVLATLAYNLYLPKQYTAAAAVVLDVKSPDPVTGVMLAGMMAPAYMATQIDIIGSERVGQIAARLLKLDQDEKMRAQWHEATQGNIDFITWIAPRLQNGLLARPSRDSNVISISYTARSPERATEVANAFAQAYLDINLDLKLAPARQYAAFFNEQVKLMRDRLDKAQQALSTYQQEHGIASADERLDYEIAKLNETSSQLTGVQAQTTDSQSKRQNGKSDTIAEVMQSPLINGLKGDIARLDAKLQESSVTLGKNHPMIQRTEAELATLRSQLERETARITTSINTTYEVGKQREQQLQGALQAQKGRVLQLNKQRDELNVLRNDVDTARRTYESLSQRASQTYVESQNSQSNSTLLNPASPPDRPSAPRVVLNVALSVFLGTLLGIGLALLLELTNRRVRSTQDLVDILDLPVLGTISARPMLKRPAGGKIAALTSSNGTLS